jgi:hypothetical protein
MLISLGLLTFPLRQGHSDALRIAPHIEHGYNPGGVLNNLVVGGEWEPLE